VKTSAALESLKTPSLLVDLNRVRGNAAQMSRRAKKMGVQLRPHIKTHKCIEIARIQTEGHSGAITVSTLAEARAFAANGFREITYAVPIDPGKFNEAVELAQQGINISLLTDDPQIPAQLNEAARKAGVKIDVFLKVDCGYHRCGVDPNGPQALEIPRRINDSSHLRFAGILTHAGHSYNACSRAQLLSIAREERDVMVACARRLEAEGIRVPVTTIGSTPTITQIDDLTGIQEVRPGNYIFFDGFQATLGSCSFDNCALTVIASVIHRSRELKKIVIDAGAIALSKDRGPVDLDATCGYGHVLDLEGNDLGLRIHSVSQEHGQIKVDDDSLLDRLSVGTRVRVLANHSCLTAAQYDCYHVLEDGQIADRWQIHRGW
jgi:D-serine deaminase-like pyridoxal phosphate-dependent protein